MRSAQFSPSSIAAGVLAAVAWAAPAISVHEPPSARRARTTITSGPIGSGYDIRISADGHGHTAGNRPAGSSAAFPAASTTSDQSAGNRTVDLEYQYEDSPTLKEGVLPDPDKVGPSEHVFPPPPGSTSQLRVELFNNDSCIGAPACNPADTAHGERPRSQRGARGRVPGNEGRRRPRRVGVDRERRRDARGQGRDEGAGPRAHRHRRAHGGRSSSRRRPTPTSSPRTRPSRRRGSTSGSPTT